MCFFCRIFNDIWVFFVLLSIQKSEIIFIRLQTPFVQHDYFTPLLKDETPFKCRKKNYILWSHIILICWSAYFVLHFNLQSNVRPDLLSTQICSANNMIVIFYVRIMLQPKKETSKNLNLSAIKYANENERKKSSVERKRD